MGRIRRNRFPPCTSIDMLADYFENNQVVQDEFGTFRGQTFYNGTLSVGAERIVVFSIKQILDEMQRGAPIFFDDTFGIIPLDFTQLFAVLAEVEGLWKNFRYVI